MMKVPVMSGLFVLLAAMSADPVSAQGRDSVRLAEVERRIDALTRELERMRLGRDVVEADSAVLGFGPAASKVYRVQQGVSIGGYGEIVYENFAAEREDGTPSGSRDIIDALRAIVYFGYKFNDRLLFNSEIEVEHANEIYLEFAYLDYRLRDDFGIRAGLLLAPLGLVNELHEPPTWLGTQRPVTETRIIPTTWRENGIGVFGGGDALAWRIYVMNSLNGGGFNAAGLRGGRQRGSRALAEDLGVAARLDYTGTLGLVAGGSAYHGGTGQGRTSAGEEVGGELLLWDLHADYRARGFELRGLVAGARLGDVAALNRVAGLTGDDGIGERMLGWYVQGGYDVLRGSRSGHQLIPFVRYEEVGTQRRVAEGFLADPANDLSVLTFGAAWKPVPQVVTKLGYQVRSNAGNTGTNQWDVQLGWIF